MALTVEDGSIVTGANTFISVDDADAYWIERDPDAVWADQDTEVKTKAILLAADYLKNEKRFKYRGSRVSYAQRLPWPRRGAVIENGDEIPDDEIPWQLKDAQAELAFRAVSAAIQPDLDRGGRIQTKTVDVLTTTFFEDAPSETVIQVVEGFLTPLLRHPYRPIASPFHAEPADLSPFETDEFKNTHQP